MAGHSKWANIKHKKKAQDAKRGKLFTKLIREITVAARQGDPNPENNPTLRAAIDKALAGNMSKDTIERAVKKGSGEMDGENYEEVRYEGYGPGGVAILVDCLTDNRNRTVAEVRHAFSKFGGNLGTDGSVSYLFSKLGVLEFEAGTDEENLMETALESGADDIVTNDDGSIEVITEVQQFFPVKEAIEQSGFKPVNAELTMRPSNSVSLDASQAETFVKLIDMLEELDDVQDVYSNVDIAEDILESLA